MDLLSKAESFVPVGQPDDLGLQLQLQEFLWNSVMDECRSLGFILMPSWVEVSICRAWDNQGEQLMKLAKQRRMQNALH